MEINGLEVVDRRKIVEKTIDTINKRLKTLECN